MRNCIPVLVLATGSYAVAESINTGVKVLIMLHENAKTVKKLDEQALEVRHTFIDSDINEVCTQHDYYQYIHGNFRLKHNNVPGNIAVVFKGDFHHGRVIAGRRQHKFRSGLSINLDPKKDFDIEISSQYAFHVDLKVLSYCFHGDYPEEIIFVIKNRNLDQIILREKAKTLAAKPHGADCYESLCDEWKIDLELDSESKKLYRSAVAILRYKEDQLPLYRQLINLLEQKKQNRKEMQSHEAGSNYYKNLQAREEDLSDREFSIYKEIIKKSVQSAVAYRHNGSVSQEIISDLSEILR